MYWESDLEGLQSIHIMGKDIEFSLIEDQTIDIDSIEELEIGTITTEDRLKLNEVIRGIKHLNKEIQSIKNKE